MKKKLAILLACSLLGACVYHETDMQLAQEQRDAALMQKRAQVGCSFLRDHDAYRQCLLDTYYSKYPTGYTTREMTNGQSVAIVNGGAQAQPLTFSSGCGCNTCNRPAPTCSTCNQGQMQVAPLPASGPQIVPYTTTATTTVGTTCTKNYMPQVASVTTTEVIPPLKVQPLPAPTPVAPPPEPTWWQEYQTTKKVEPVKPVCPCPDPNDPCPQCVDK